MQGLLLLAHWFVYRTWIVFWWPLGPLATLILRAFLTFLAFSFVAAALLGFYFANRPVTLLYKVASVWLGFLNYFFWAACLCRITRLVLVLAGSPVNTPLLAAVFYGLAILVSIYGLVNAQVIRVRRSAIRLDGLPASWRGRSALILSDLHLGHINGPGFARRIVKLATRLKPDLILIPGDLFDGGKADPTYLAEPLRALSPAFGTFFSTGNHDEFGDTAHYIDVLTRVGIRVLVNEKVTVDGLDIVGVNYGDSGYPIRLRSILDGLGLDRGRATILLNHVPNRLPIAEEAGIGLQVSGHTHCGQFFPFNWPTRHIFGKYTFGLQRFGKLQVYTSVGAGTWGPPLRVGTSSEVVLLTFE